MKHHLAKIIAIVLLAGCGNEAIHEAAATGNIQAVIQQLDAGTDVNSKDKNGWIALHDAVYFGSIEITEILITNGADVNAKADGGCTPLHLAAKNAHIEVVELLLAKGANVNANDDFGDTPLDWVEMMSNCCKGIEDNVSEVKGSKKELTAILRKHGGKKGEEVKAEEK
mgnify:FL=1|jgi:ankyrin repeat protein